MFRIHRLPVLGSDLTRHGNPTTAIAGAVYIGLGDRFDDDRRLVRETASKLRPYAQLGQRRAGPHAGSHERT